MSATIEEFDFSVNLLKALLWRHNDAANLQSLLESKNSWYEANQTDFWNDWVTNVFNLETANEFGLSVWAQILGIPLSLIVPPNAGPQFGFGVMTYNAPLQLSYPSEQPVTSASVTSMRRAGGWQGDRALFATARTNLVSAIQNWSVFGTGTAITANAGIAPDGTTTATLLTFGSGGVVYTLLNNAASAPYTYSAFVKSGSLSSVAIGDDKETPEPMAVFNLATGTVSSVSAGATAAITSYHGGWFRCSITFTEQATPPTLDSFVLWPSGAMGTLYGWGAQEERSAVPTPYIPTTTAPATVTDYTVSNAGALTFAVAPGAPLTDNIYWSGSYTTAASAIVTAVNRTIARTYTANGRQNFDNGNFGTAASGIGLNLEQKRILLQLQYYKLISRCTVPEVNERLKAILKQYGSVYVLDGNNMAFTTYVFGFQPNSALQFVLENFNVLPRPAAVGIKYIVSTRPAFGFGAFNQNFNNGTFWAEN